MTETAAATPALRMSTARGRWVVAATVLGSGMAALDATVVGIALPAIGRDFHVGIASLQWVVNAYTLTLAGLLLLGGARAAGRRRGAADPGQPGHPAGLVRRGGPDGRHRRVVGAWRRGDRYRSLSGRVADRRGVLAASFFHQPAAGRGSDRHLRPARARDQGAGSGAAARLPRRADDQRRAGRDHLRPDRGVGGRLDIGLRAGAPRRGPAPARRVHPD